MSPYSRPDPWQQGVFRAEDAMVHNREFARLKAQYYEENLSALLRAGFSRQEAMRILVAEASKPVIVMQPPILPGER